MNISEDCCHIYLLGQPLTKLNNTEERRVSVRTLNFIAITVVKFRIPPR